MFSSIKLWAIGIATSAFAILLALFKYKSKKLDEAEEVIKDQAEEIEVVYIEKAVSIDIRSELEEAEELRERKYEIQRKVIENMPDTPLSAELKRMLQDRHNKI